MITGWIQPLFEAALDFIYPRACVCCHCELFGESSIFCHDCENSLSHIQSPICPTCGSPVLEDHSDQNRCGNCPSGKHYFGNIRAELDYNDENVQRMIHTYKFEYIQPLAKDLSRYMIQTYDAHYANENIDAIVPVPLHKSRQRQREFNQSFLLAQYVAKHSDLPLQNDWIIRSRKTQPQTTLNLDERMKNIQNAFSVSKPDAVIDQTILLIDDVVTTGSTINELSRILHEHGAKRILVLSLARAYAQIKLK